MSTVTPRVVRSIASSISSPLRSTMGGIEPLRVDFVVIDEISEQAKSRWIASGMEVSHSGFSCEQPSVAHCINQTRKLLRARSRRAMVRDGHLPRPDNFID